MSDLSSKNINELAELIFSAKTEKEFDSIIDAICIVIEDSNDSCIEDILDI